MGCAVLCSVMLCRAALLCGGVSCGRQFLTSHYLEREAAEAAEENVHPVAALEGSVRREPVQADRHAHGNLEV